MAAEAKENEAGLKKAPLHIFAHYPDFKLRG